MAKRYCKRYCLDFFRHRKYRRRSGTMGHASYTVIIWTTYSGCDCLSFCGLSPRSSSRFRRETPAVSLRRRAVRGGREKAVAFAQNEATKNRRGSYEAAKGSWRTWNERVESALGCCLLPSTRWVTMRRIKNAK